MPETRLSRSVISSGSLTVFRSTSGGWVTKEHHSEVTTGVAKNQAREDEGEPSRTWVGCKAA